MLLRAVLRHRLALVTLIAAAGSALGVTAPAAAADPQATQPVWLNSVSWLDLDASYHPNAAGQADGYLPAFTAAAAG